VDEARAATLAQALNIGAEALCEIAKTASRNQKSLTGTGVYAGRFHDEVVKVTKVFNLVRPVLTQIDALDLAAFTAHLDAVRNPGVSFGHRDAARKQIALIVETQIIPNLGNLSGPAQSATEPVIPLAVFATAPTYYKNTVIQANGCYEKRWFEACSVMIRKLVENMIIDVYEKHGKKAEIQKDGLYMMLAGLVAAMLSQTHWTLGRETREALPELKKLGDRAAHNRRYWATKPDIDKVLSGLRVTADDLLHLAGHK
jgi:hypothetical protein